MALAIRTQIVKSLAAELATMTVASGYSFTPRAVYTLMPNDLLLDGQSPQPCIFIWPGQSAASLTEYIGGVAVELDLHIVVSGQKCYSAQEVGAEMAADVEKLFLSADPRSIGGALVRLEPYSATISVSDIEEYQPGFYGQYVAYFCTQIGDPRTAFVTA